MDRSLEQLVFEFEHLKDCIGRSPDNFTKIRQQECRNTIGRCLIEVHYLDEAERVLLTDLESLMNQFSVELCNYMANRGDFHHLFRLAYLLHESVENTITITKPQGYYK